MRPFGPLPLILPRSAAELARELAHRGARVRFGKRRFVDLRRGGRHFWRRGRLRRRGNRRGCARRGRLVEPPAGPTRAHGPWPAAQRRTGAAAAGAAAAGAAAACAAAGTAFVSDSAAASSSNISEPSETLSPDLTETSAMRPAAGAGTSIAAFSVSIVINGVSFSICWPGLTSTSTTLTSLNPPMSGTNTLRGAATTRA